MRLRLIEQRGHSAEHPDPRRHAGDAVPEVFHRAGAVVVKVVYLL